MEIRKIHEKKPYSENSTHQIIEDRLRNLMTNIFSSQGTGGKSSNRITKRCKQKFDPY